MGLVIVTKGPEFKSHKGGGCFYHARGVSRVKAFLNPNEKMVNKYNLAKIGGIKYIRFL